MAAARLAPGICCVVVCFAAWYFSPWCSKAPTFGKYCYEGMPTAPTPALGGAAPAPIPPAGLAPASALQAPAPASALPSSAAAQAVLNDGAPAAAPTAGVSSPTPTPSPAGYGPIPSPTPSNAMAVTTQAPMANLAPVPTPAPVVATPAPTPPAPVATKQIDFYFEIGCPVCQVLLSGVMKTVASTYADSVNVDFHPWGNSFYGMASCSSDLAPKPESTVNPDPRYTPTARYCWSGKCGAEAPTKDPECFKGPMICQHGPKACDLQGYALCGKKALGDDWQKVLEFMSCLEEGHKKAGEYEFPTGSVGFIAKDCCKKGGLDFATIDTCVKGDELTQLTMAEAGSTPKHRLVPYVVVDGEVLHGIGATPNMLITAIESTTPAVGPAAARRLTVI